MSSSAAIYQFGSLEFYPSQQLLAGPAERAALTATLNKLLLLFVSRPGQLVTRDEIANALWDDHGTVDIENGINGAIRRLRQQLAAVSSFDVVGTLSATIYIDTVVGTGYRFTPPVTLVVPAAAHTIEAGPGAVTLEAPAPIAKRGRWLRNALFCCLALAMAGWAYERGSRRIFTAAPDTAPAFALEPFPVTYEEPEQNITAQAISPSGQFVVVSDRDGLAIQPLHSQNSTRIQSAHIRSPTGLIIDHLSWFADEKHLLASGLMQGNNHDPVHETWLLDTESAQRADRGDDNEHAPSLLLSDAALANVSPDGRRVAYLRAGMSEVWVANADGQNTRRLIDAKAGDAFTAALWSPASDRVVVDRVTSDPRGNTDANKPAVEQLQQHQHFAYESYAVATGKLLARTSDLSFHSALLLADGRFIYPVGVVGESLKFAAARTDLATGKILSSNNLNKQIDIGLGVTSVRDLTSTRTGETLSALFERPSADVHVGTLHSAAAGTNGPPTLTDVYRFTRRTGSTYPTSWSPDGKTLVFDSGDAGRWFVAQEAIGASSLTVLADTGGRAVQGQYTPDGKSILFLHYIGTPTHVLSIDRVAATGGAPQPIYTSSNIEDFHCSRSPRGICVVRESVGNEALVYYLLDPMTGRGPELARTAWETNVLGDWSLSADGKTVAKASHDLVHPGFSVIPLVNPVGLPQPTHTNLRFQTHKLATRKITVAGFGNVLCPSWTVEGNGFFVETHAETGYELVYVDLRGNASLFLKSPDPIWAVQSRDGKKLAFPARTPLNRNVWAANIQ